MNIDAFRRLLGDLAAEAPANAPGHQRLAGIDAKVAQARRTRAVVGVGGVAAVVVIAAVVAPHVARDADPTPPVTTDSRHTVPIDLTPTKLPTVTDHGTVFYKDAAGMRLIGHEVADPGHRWLTLTVTPHTRNLSLTFQCWWLSDQRGVGGTRFSTYVNGTRMEGAAGYCFQPPRGPLEGLDFDDSDSPKANRQMWAGLGVVPGEPTTIRMHMRGPDAAAAQSQLVFGLYTAGDRSRVAGTWYHTEEIRDGREYRTLPALTKAFSGRHWVLSRRLPPSPNPYFVWTGAVDMHARGTLRLLPGDHGSSTGRNPGGRSSGTFHSGHGPVRVTFRGAPWSTGRLWLAVYRQTR